MNSRGISWLIVVAGLFPLVGCQNLSTRQTMKGETVGEEVPAVARTSDELVPPNAKPGECYARVILPPVYQTVAEQRLAKEAAHSIEIVPAEFEEVEQRVLVKEASEELVVVPAVYKTITEQVLVTPATTRLVTVPAEYKTVTEQVLVKPAHTVWKKGANPLQTLTGATGEIMCLVNVPAEYTTVQKQVLVTPATTREEQIPATYKTMEKTVLVSGPTTQKVAIPAEYGVVKVTRVKTPEQKRVSPIPAAFETVERTVIAQPSRTGWQRILCETNVTPAIIADLQSKLALRGFDPGPADGTLNERTTKALTTFQQANSLAIGGVTYESLDKLAVNY